MKGYLITCCLIACTTACSDKTIPTQMDYAPEPNRQLWTADWSPDGKYIAVAGVDSLLRIYHADHLKLHRSYPIESWIHVVKWHPQQRLLAVGTYTKSIYLVNLDTGRMQHLDGSGGSRALDWNATGELLAVADLDGVLRIWDKHGTPLRTIDLQYGPDINGKSFLGLDWHPQQDTFVATNFAVHLFRSEGEHIKTLKHPNPEAIMLCAAWHPSGEFFVVGDYGHNWEGENVPSLLHFWNADGSYRMSVSGSKAEYRNICWNPDGTELATASDILRIWDRDGVLLHESPPDSTNLLWGIDWSPDGRRIVTTSRFQTVALWDDHARLIRSIDLDQR